MMKKMPNKKIAQLLMIYIPLIGFAILGFKASWKFTSVFIGIIVFVIGFVWWTNDNIVF